MSNLVEYILKMTDNASPSLRHVAEETQHVADEAENAGKSYAALGDIIKGTAIGNLVSSGIQTAIGAIGDFVGASQEAYNMQATAETKLAQVMRNSMGASEDEIQSIKDLASAQQQLGVIGDEVQLAGAQELGTYLEKTDTLKKLIPVMNDMVAQQYGLEASQESATGIATMLGKVMEGQVGALSRYGYSFDEAQEKVLKFGTEEERAAVLADVVSASVGGMNEALAKTPEGQIKQLSNDLGDFQEQIGKAIVRIKQSTLPLQRMGMELLQKLMPHIERLVTFISDGVGKIVSFISDNSGAFISFFQPAVDLVHVLWDSFGGLMDYLSPIGDFFAEHVLPTVQRISTAVGEIVGKVVNWVSQSVLLKDIFSAIMWVAGKIFDFIGTAIENLVKAITWIWDNILEPIISAIEKAYRWIKGDDGGKQKTPPPALQSGPGADNGNNIQPLPTPTNDNSTEEQASKVESAIKGGGQKVVNINLGKFFDNIEFHTTNLEESVENIEQTVLECLARVLANGATI